MPVRFFPIDKVEFSLSTWDHYSVSLSVQHLLPRSVLLWSDIEQRQPPCQVAGLSYHAKSHETFSDVGLVIPSHRLILSIQDSDLLSAYLLFSAEIVTILRGCDDSIHGLDTCLLP